MSRLRNWAIRNKHIGRLRCWIIRNGYHPIYTCNSGCFYECPHWRKP